MSPEARRQEGFDAFDLAVQWFACVLVQHGGDVGVGFCVLTIEGLYSSPSCAPVAGTNIFRNDSSALSTYALSTKSSNSRVKCCIKELLPGLALLSALSNPPSVPAIRAAGCCFRTGSPDNTTIASSRTIARSSSLAWLASYMRNSSRKTFRGFIVRTRCESSEC